MCRRDMSTVQEVGSTGFTSAVLQEQAYSAVQSEQQPTTVITDSSDYYRLPVQARKSLFLSIPTPSGVSVGHECLGGAQLCRRDVSVAVERLFWLQCRMWVGT